jgi:hypothetical protein
MFSNTSRLNFYFISTGSAQDYGLIDDIVDVGKKFLPKLTKLAEPVVNIIKNALSPTDEEETTAASYDASDIYADPSASSSTGDGEK